MANSVERPEVGVPTALQLRRRRRRRNLVGLLVVLAVALVFLRRQLAALRVRAVPYIRRRSRVRRPALIINRWSGDGKAERFGLVEAAREAGIETIMLEPGDDIAQLARDAIDAGADAIGAAGGDGSLGLVASIAIERDVPFFCIPIGTRNHFALDLGLDRDDPLSALEAIRDGDELLIDVGVAGDRLFVNNVSFGVYAEAVHRDEYRANKEKTIATVIDEMASGEEGGGFTLRFRTPTGDAAERTAMTLVSNNPYEFAGPPDYGRRLRLDHGRLGIHSVGTGVSADGRHGAGARSWEAETFRLESDGPILAGVDGEAITFESPLVLSIRPRALRILVPSGTKPGYVPPREVLAANLIGLARLAGVPGLVDDET